MNAIELRLWSQSGKKQGSYTRAGMYTNGFEGIHPCDLI